MARKSRQTEFPNRIRELREAAGLTLEQLGGRAGIHFANLAKMETTGKGLRIQHMEAIARELGVNPADLHRRDHGALSLHERNIMATYQRLPAQMRKAFDSLHESLKDYAGDPEVLPFPGPTDRTKPD